MGTNNDNRECSNCGRFICTGYGCGKYVDDCMKDGNAYSNWIAIGSSLSNEEMIANIKVACGDQSASYYNICNHKNADNNAVKVLYEQILEREENEIQRKIAELRKQLDIVQGFKNNIRTRVFQHLETNTKIVDTTIEDEDKEETPECPYADDISTSDCSHCSMGLCLLPSYDTCPVELETLHGGKKYE